MIEVNSKIPAITRKYTKIYESDKDHISVLSVITVILTLKRKELEPTGS